MTTSLQTEVRYHVNPETGNVGRCVAKIKCDFVEHFPSVDSAIVAAERLMEQKMSKDKDLGLSKFSFVRRFKKEVEKFEKDFDGIPTRFFNADLRKNGLVLSEDVNEQNIDEFPLDLVSRAAPEALLSRATQFLSVPQDNHLSDKDVYSLGADLGFDVSPVEDEGYLRSLGGLEKAWVFSRTYTDENGDEQTSYLVVSPDKKVGQNLRTYRMMRAVPEGLPKNFKVAELRSVLGAARMTRKTGLNPFNTLVDKKNLRWANYGEEDRKELVTTILRLEDAQLEGRSFKAQQSYVKNSSGKIATVWEEKKDTDDIRKEMASKSKLRGVFRKIDLDNDIDPEAFAKFESDYESAQKHLPKFPKGLEPSLHIRKLGKHSSSNFHVHGLFNPAKNAVAIDINDGGSSSTVHEIFHQYDIITKGNLSLTPEFRALSKEYAADLKVPAAMAKKSDYYHIPTEQFARFAEVYMHSKLGDDTMLLDAEKFSSFDYAPIMNNESLKKKIFAFFDKHLASDVG